MMQEAMLKDKTLKPGYEILDLKNDQIYTFSQGLPGFEKVTQYCLLSREEEAPFLHLSALGGFNLEFIVLCPWYVCADYKPEISDDDLEAIGSPALKELIVLAIVVVNEPIGQSTINLVAPIIINSKTFQGKQVVIRNFKDYSNQQMLVTDS
jgi:flagellar assembly factor FliW